MHLSLSLFVRAVNIFPIKESNFRVRSNLWKCITKAHIKVQDEGDESGQEECMSLPLTVMWKTLWTQGFTVKQPQTNIGAWLLMLPRYFFFKQKLSLHDVVSLSHCCGGIFAHCSFKIVLEFIEFCGSLFMHRSLDVCCSISARLRTSAADFCILILFLSDHVVVDLLVFLGSLYPCMTQSWPSFSCLTDGLRLQNQAQVITVLSGYEVFVWKKLSPGQLFQTTILFRSFESCSFLHFLWALDSRALEQTYLDIHSWEE